MRFCETNPNCWDVIFGVTPYANGSYDGTAQKVNRVRSSGSGGGGNRDRNVAPTRMERGRACRSPPNSEKNPGGPSNFNFQREERR